MTHWHWIAFSVAVVLAAPLAWIGLIAYATIKYGKFIYRIFETKPLFLVPQVAPDASGETVEFSAPDGRRRVGTYLPHTASARRGVILFLHEYGANRWLAIPYAGYLRSSGFDVFTFDFCNHGDSESIAGYEPLQWVTKLETADLAAAIAYLRRRADAPPGGIGVYGVSKGGSTVLAAGREPYVRAIVTDSAFPTHGTVTEYETRWGGIYITRRIIAENLPRVFWTHMTWLAVRRMRRAHGVHYVNVERSLRQLAGIPLLMIHGSRDNYINQEIVRRFYDCAREPKELWIVQGAKHNGCLDKAGDAYRSQVRNFFLTHLANETAGVTAAHDERPEPAFCGNGHVEKTGHAEFPVGVLDK